MAQTQIAPRTNTLSELAALLAVGIGFAGLLRAGRALVVILSILECSGAIGGTRIVTYCGSGSQRPTPT
jgi:hypothetical protein